MTPTGLVTRRIPSLSGPYSPVASALDETHVCDGTAFGVAITAGRATAYWVKPSGTTGLQVLAGSGVPLASDVLARLTCAGRWPVVVLTSADTLEFHALPDASASFRSDAITGTPPAARDGLCVGPTGLIGGGAAATGAPIADLVKLTEAGFLTMRAAGSGPRRSGAVLVEAGADVLALGGRASAGLTQLASLESQGFAEAATTGLQGVRATIASARTPAGEVEAVVAPDGIRIEPGGAHLAGLTWASLAYDGSGPKLMAIAGVGTSANLYECGPAGASCVARGTLSLGGPSRLGVRGPGVYFALPVAGGAPVVFGTSGEAIGLTFGFASSGINAASLAYDSQSLFFAHATSIGGTPAQRFTVCDVSPSTGEYPCMTGSARGASSPAIPLRLDARTQVLLTRQGFLDLTTGELVTMPVPLPPTDARLDVGSAPNPTSSMAEWSLPDPNSSPSQVKVVRGADVAAVLALSDAAKTSGTVRARIAGSAQPPSVTLSDHTGVAPLAPTTQDGWHLVNWNFERASYDATLLIHAPSTIDVPSPQLEIDFVSVETTLLP